MRRGRIKEYAETFNVQFIPKTRPWEVPCDVALPCATQNELGGADAQRLVENGVTMVAEGANMPSTPEAIEVLQSAGKLFIPGKASNAGGVACSGLEMSQNSLRMHWTREEVDGRLQAIMQDIHKQCVTYGQTPQTVDYVKGANLGGFIKVAEAMMAYGVG